MATMAVPASTQLIIILLMASFAVVFCHAIDNPVGEICDHRTDNRTSVCRGRKGLKISHIVEEVPIVEEEPISTPGESSSSTPATKSPAVGGIPRSTTTLTAGSSASTTSPFIAARSSLQSVALAITVASFLFSVFGA